ncbi:TlpA disulfide reductase family protein [Nannocystis bainbridge]|uniref:Redoxin domain-containing protein n=1 Tax=Nannocystis bainbridge TaxID=2995303 RepID=A0ABT5E1N0_9BACT|nr:redoxin domain-containing protein [Nannocystis bainbridge]MDC0718637.1 redoxin domain-containing protein [Nannocystis bainbridge]
MTFKQCPKQHVLMAISLLAPLELGCKREASEAPESTAVAEPEAPVQQPVEAPASEPVEAPARDTAPADKPPGDVVAANVPTAEPAGEVKPATASALPAALHTKVDDSCGRDAGVGTSALPFALKTAEGKDISMASLRGKVVLLNFWGTWCKPCLKELPEFDRLIRHYKKQGAVLVAVATDTEPEKVLEFAKERRISAKLVLGGEDLAKQYDSPNFPFSFVVDEKGTIRGSYRSYKPECIGRIEQDIRTSLEQKKR